MLRATAALFRAIIIWLVFVAAGRLLGWFVGRAMERALDMLSVGMPRASISRAISPTD